MKRKKLILCSVPLLGVLGLALVAQQQYPTLAVYTAYKAKMMCSGLFLCGLPEERLNREDVGAGYLAPLQDFDTRIDHAKRTVTVSHLLVTRSAVYREGVGVTLAIGLEPEELPDDPMPVPAPTPLPKRPWPEGDGLDEGPLAAGIAPLALAEVVQRAFVEPDPENLLRTRAVVVIHRGRLIAEKYAPGITGNTRLPGWSMAKSLTNALIGIAVHQKRMRLDQDRLFPDWTSPGDQRASMTVKHLLQWSSGLAFDEKYFDATEEAPRMLFRTGDASGLVLELPPRHEPGTVCSYSSGDSNLLCRALRDAIGNDAEYHAFPYRELFHRIGAHSFVLERDASGTFVGSSFAYATGRDWARFGLLYARDGLWNGQRILPEDWVRFSRSGAPANETGQFAAHFHLRVIRDPSELEHPSPLPPEAFHMSGFHGQYVTIIPERELVVVRLGLTLAEGQGAWDHEHFVARIMNVLP